MTIQEELKGCLLVLSHLDDDNFVLGKNISISDFKNHPPFKNMLDYLDSKKDDFYNYKGVSKIMSGYSDNSMLYFTVYINLKYKIQKDPLWDKSAREFFSTTKSRNFYKTIIRTLKLELLCQN